MTTLWRGIIITWVAREYALVIRLKSRRWLAGTLVDKRDVRFAGYSSSGMVFGVPVVVIDLEQSRGT